MLTAVVVAVILVCVLAALFLFALGRGRGRAVMEEAEVEAVVMADLADIQSPTGRPFFNDADSVLGLSQLLDSVHRDFPETSGTEQSGPGHGDRGALDV